MRKTALVIAGAIAFDLGVLVASSHAAPPPGPGPYMKVDGTAAPAYKANLALKTYKFLKFDTVNTSKSCATGHGTPTTQGGVKGCLLPNAEANSAMQEVSTTR
jgi:hypothetical protein